MAFLKMLPLLGFPRLALLVSRYRAVQCAANRRLYCTAPLKMFSEKYIFKYSTLHILNSVLYILYFTFPKGYGLPETRTAHSG